MKKVVIITLSCQSYVDFISLIRNMDANAKLILGTAYFSSTHFFERISYYGFRTLLVMYAVNELALSEASSYGLYENFTLIVYLIPLIAGPFLDFVFKAKHGPVIGGGFFCDRIVQCAFFNPPFIRHRCCVDWSRVVIHAGWCVHGVRKPILYKRQQKRCCFCR